MVGDLKLPSKKQSEIVKVMKHLLALAHAGRIVALGYAVLNLDDDGDVSAGTNAVWADNTQVREGSEDGDVDAEQEDRGEKLDYLAVSGEKVVALSGYSVPTPNGEPVKSVVDILREFAAKAESGELRAVFIAAVEQDGKQVTGDFAAAAGHSWDLYAAVGRAKRRFDFWLDQ